MSNKLIKSKSSLMKQTCFCGNSKCKLRIARIRENKLWVKVGIYHTKCHGFTPLSQDKISFVEEYGQDNFADVFYPANESFQNSECIHQHDSFTIN